MHPPIRLTVIFLRILLWIQYSVMLVPNIPKTNMLRFVGLEKRKYDNNTME